MLIKNKFKSVHFHPSLFTGVSSSIFRVYIHKIIWSRYFDSSAYFCDLYSPLFCMHTAHTLQTHTQHTHMHTHARIHTQHARVHTHAHMQTRTNVRSINVHKMDHIGTILCTRVRPYNSRCT